MEMEDYYAISDLRQFISRPTMAQFPPQPSSIPSSSNHFAPHNHLRELSPLAGVPAQQHPYDRVVLGHSMSAASADMLHPQQYYNNTTTTRFLHHKDHQFNSESTTTTTTTTFSGNFDGCGGGVARWPRQETLNLLEVRSKLDHKFKEANQKGPLWDEVARIMCEEHGYQRTGKKCKEKFENLYKYYKKTKEGKAGRQDGKHYRFFRQLEALYGDHNNNQHHHYNHHSHPTSEAGRHIAGNYPISASLSSSSSDFETSSSDNDVGGSTESEEFSKKMMKKIGKRSWKAKIKEFIDQQMRKIMEKQEAWLDKMMKTLENREKERIQREVEWRKKESERIEREHMFWANERAWIEARDSALMTALEKINNEKEHCCSDLLLHLRNRNHDHHCRVEVIQGGDNNDELVEEEVTRLIQLRTSMESRFQQRGFLHEVLWEDIGAKMAYLGYNRSVSVWKEKWDSISKYFIEKDNIIIRDLGNKKRKENYEEVSNINHNYNTNQLGGFSGNFEIIEQRVQLNEGSSSPSSHNSNVNVNVNANKVSVASGSVMNDSFLRFFHGDGQGDLGWEGGFGMNLNKNGVNHCV